MIQPKIIYCCLIDHKLQMQHLIVKIILYLLQKNYQYGIVIF